MHLKFVFQILLTLIILTIIGIFYYNFFVLEKNKDLSISEKPKINENLDSNFSNELLNIEYNSTDKDGNAFYINAEKAFIEFDNENDDENKDIVSMEKVISIINLKERGIINIYADNAVYNKVNNNTFFSNNVIIEYLDNTINAENLDVIFTDKISRVYNNVLFKNNNLNLITDKIFINMLTGNIKLEIKNDFDKVKLITNYELAN